MHVLHSSICPHNKNVASEFMLYFWSLCVFMENNAQLLLFSAKFPKHFPVQMYSPICKTFYLPYLALIEITCGVPEMLRAWAEKQKCKGFLSSHHH